MILCGDGGFVVFSKMCDGYGDWVYMPMPNMLRLSVGSIYGTHN